MHIDILLEQTLVRWIKDAEDSVNLKPCRAFTTIVWCTILFIKKRHNDIVKRIKKAAEGRWTVLGKDRVVGTENLRSELVSQKGKDCHY